MNGVLVINKPMDFTSFDVVALMRGLTKQRKIGHCGTLDPNATGVLPLLLGEATKAQDLIPNHDKEYIATMKFGTTTDTLDIWGNLTSQVDSDVHLHSFEQVISEFRGEIEQIPPMYSAIQVDGKRLYDLARKGVEVERESRKVTIYNLVPVDFDNILQTATIRVSCSKGTYIRSLIDDIGKRLSCGAVMTALERTSACGYNTADSITIEQARTLSASGELEKYIRPCETLFERFPEITITEKQAIRFSNGGALDIERVYSAKKLDDNQVVRVKGNNSFLGLGKIDKTKNMVKILKIFCKN